MPTRLARRVARVIRRNRGRVYSNMEACMIFPSDRERIAGVTRAAFENHPISKNAEEFRALPFHGKVPRGTVASREGFPAEG